MGCVCENESQKLVTNMGNGKLSIRRYINAGWMEHMGG